MKLYLKPNLVIEPLIENWYAWSHLISPATAAMNITKRHLTIMNSYVESPELHMEAIKDAKMMGGPFMDYKKNRVEDIRKLIASTVDHQSELIELSFAIKKLNNLIKDYPKGYSLEELYDKIPELLKGYVELVYDINDNLSFRFFEELLYESRFYNEKYQSIALWLTENDERPFCLSTPRIDDENVILLQIPFRSDIIDRLSKMKSVADDFNSIAALLSIPENKMELFRTFFTEQAPPLYQKYTGDKIRMRYFGHACILLETSDLTILIDPLISYYGYKQSLDHFSDLDLPEVIDYVLITHNHQDHILFETLLPLRHKIKNLIVPRSGSGSLQDPKLKLMFKKIGFHQVSEIDEMESLKMSDCTITGIPFMGEHSDLDIKSKICYHVNIGSFTVLLVADSRVMEGNLYKHIQTVIGNVDVIFLGMECDGAPLSWLYGPLVMYDINRQNDQSRRLSGSDCTKGMKLVDIFNPLEVYVYAMGQEPWCEFISSIKYTDESNPIVQSNRLIEICSEKGIIAERLYGEKEILYSKKSN